jgi:hypothetical protein
MDKNIETINRINNEYFALISKHIRNIEICSINYPVHKIWQVVVETSGLVFQSRFGSVNAVQYKTLSLLFDILSFWKENVDSYRSAAMSVNSTKVFDTLFNRNQLLFFDTIVIYHLAYRNALLVFEDNSYDPLNSTILTVRMMRDLHFVLPYLNTNHDKPMVILDIAGPIEQKKIVNIYGNQIELNEKERSERNINEVLQEIALDEYKNLTLIDYHLITKKKGIIDVSKIFNIKKLIKLLDSTLIDEKLSTAKEWNDFVNGNSTTVMTDIFAYLIQGIATSIMDIDCQELGCFEYKADPIVNHIELYKRRLTIESTRTSIAMGQSIEYGIAQSLDLPNFNWINNITEEDLIHFRENNGTEFLRNVFSQQRGIIKFASIDDFESISKKAIDTIRECIVEENNRIKAEKEKIKRQLIKTSISFLTTISLGVVSVALPPLIAITIPSAIFSTIVGSASIKDINEIYKNRRINERLMRDRPLGIITKYLK